MRSAIGIVLASVVVFVFGFAYWGVSTLPYASLQKPKDQDDVALGRVLREHLPTNGTYIVPGMYNDEATMTTLHEQGPVAIIHLVARDGSPAMDPMIMVQGFALNLVTMILLALLLRIAALRGYGSRVLLVTIAGIAGSVFINGGSTIWWGVDLAWMIHTLIYDAAAWLIAGVVLAAFVKPQRPATTGGDD